MSEERKYPKEFLERLKEVKGKRPRTVIDLIMKNGHVTTEDLAKAGYEHAPRAVRDVRELGIPIVTKRVTDSNGKSIASYKFGDLNKITDVVSKKAGRTAQLNKIRHNLAVLRGARCSIYLEEMPEKELQVDHRIPFEIAGEQPIENIGAFMLLSPSANRKKSWTCEHCKNWTVKDVKMCRTCYWAYPDNYTHVAGKPERIVEVKLDKEDVALYDKIVKEIGRSGINNMIREAIERYKKS